MSIFTSTPTARLRADEGDLSSLSRLPQGPARQPGPAVGNKRLSHALSLVKAQQDLRREPKVLTHREKTAYRKRPRQLYGPDFIKTRSRQER